MTKKRDIFFLHSAIIHEKILSNNFFRTTSMYEIIFNSLQTIILAITTLFNQLYIESIRIQFPPLGWKIKKVFGEKI